MKLHHNHCRNCKCIKCVKQFFRGTMVEVVMATLLTHFHWFLASIFKFFSKHFYSFPPSPFSSSHTIWMISLKVKSMQKPQCAATSDRRLKIAIYMLWGLHYHKCNSPASNKSLFFHPVEDTVWCWTVNVYWKTLDKNQLKRPGNPRGLWVYNLQSTCRQTLCQVYSHACLLKSYLFAHASFHSPSMQVFSSVTTGYFRSCSQSTFRKQI